MFVVIIYYKDEGGDPEVLLARSGKRLAEILLYAKQDRPSGDFKVYQIFDHGDMQEVQPRKTEGFP